MKLSGKDGIPAGLRHTKVTNTGFLLNLYPVAFSMFDHFVGLTLTGLRNHSPTILRGAFRFRGALRGAFSSILDV